MVSHYNMWRKLENVIIQATIIKYEIVIEFVYAMLWEYQYRQGPWCVCAWCAWCLALLHSTNKCTINDKTWLILLYIFKRMLVRQHFCFRPYLWIPSTSKCSYPQKKKPKKERRETYFSVVYAEVSAQRATEMNVNFSIVALSCK